MTAPVPQARFTRWIVVGLVAAIVLITLRLGIPIYRRKLAIDKLERLGTVISAANFPNPTMAPPRRESWWTKAAPAEWQTAFDEIVSFTMRDSTISSSVDWRPSARSETHEILLTLPQFPELRWLNLDDADLTDEDLLHLADLRDLEILVLANTRLRGPGLRHLFKPSKLRQLVLSKTDIDDSALEIVVSMTSLESVWLDGTRITNAGLKHLEKLPKLRGLSCSNTEVTEAGLDELLKSHPELSVTDD